LQRFSISLRDASFIALFPPKATLIHREKAVFPLVFHVFPLVFSTFPLVNRLFPTRKSFFPLVFCVFPLVNRLFPSVNKAFPLVFRAFPLINQDKPWITCLPLWVKKLGLLISKKFRWIKEARQPPIPPTLWINARLILLLRQTMFND